ncbi:SDR family NAD(P)-dependent oxidoreductase [Aestuariispira insulae]|uniref:NAD(P)-dependent dehydrogenase (Short-subunit alcohol dehydrogenase family) n=1 Tax=Aestuariispira insulae TaxID=1461337 RepID=A0A3D9HW09_9PROT|nr:SDR family NAD(P)-dependent oxidoreductase [Aestuariispira insulae]RED53571.1 NAD(P)-dependent dehydrogenase (short-subunit alcohol dehydrogenase family) [Aestuariispira insulae]
MAEKKLEGRIALVTGASRGIGFAVARRMAEEGAHVVALARTVGGLEELDDIITEKGGKCTLVPLDLRDGDKIDALGASLYERFGRLDILVGNAGILGELSPVGHLPPKLWEETFSVNTHANFRLIRSLDPLLRQSDAGRAIFVSSEIAQEQRPFWSLYAASKAALEALVQGYAAEIGNITNIRANIIHPGPVATAMRAKAYPGEDQKKLNRPWDITDRFIEMASSNFNENGTIVRL